MLSRYDGKAVRVVTEDGYVCTGVAQAFPPGYGLCEFDRSEESLLVDGTQIFKTDIAGIEVLPESGEAETPAPRDGAPERIVLRFQDLMEELLQTPVLVADILPRRVPQGAKGQYFAVERYFLRPDRRKALRRKQAELLLRLNCYARMSVSFDSCETWEDNPDPEGFAEALEDLSGNAFLRAVFPDRRTMIDLDPTDTWMSVCCEDAEFEALLRTLAAPEGIFLWRPEECEENTESS